MDSAASDTLWIGIFGVTGSPANPYLEGAQGAYVNVLAPAADEAAFRSAVAAEGDALGLEIDEGVFCEPLQAHRRSHAVDPDLLALADEALATGRVQFGPFDPWQG